MFIREYAPLCLAKVPAGGEPKRLGVDRSPSGRIMEQGWTGFKRPDRGRGLQREMLSWNSPSEAALSPPEETVCMRRLSVLLAFVLAALFSCDGSDRGAPMLEKFEGILQTDANCKILGGDTSDFLPRPEPASLDTAVSPPILGPPGNNSLIGACPNPAETSTTISCQLAEQDSMWIFAYDEPGAPPVDTVVTLGNANAGYYRLAWSAPAGPGIYRVRMFTKGGFQSYGDVEFTGPQ